MDNEYWKTTCRSINYSFISLFSVCPNRNEKSAANIMKKANLVQKTESEHLLNLLNVSYYLYLFSVQCTENILIEKNLN